MTSCLCQGNLEWAHPTNFLFHHVAHAFMQPIFSSKEISYPDPNCWIPFQPFASPFLAGHWGSQRNRAGWQIHDRIKPNLVANAVKVKLSNLHIQLVASKTSLNVLKAFETTAMAPGVPKVANKVKKSIILAEFDAACHAKGISNHTSTITKDETIPTSTYPSH